MAQMNTTITSALEPAKARSIKRASCSGHFKNAVTVVLERFVSATLAATTF